MSRPRRGSEARRDGFTLVEVLVGMAVAALVLTAGFSTLAFVRDRAVRSEAAVVPALAGATTRALLTEWLSGALARAPRRGVRFQGLDAAVTGGVADEIVFPTTARTPLSVGTTVVRLYVDVQDSTVERGLVAALSERATDTPRRVELLPQVTGMEIRYLPNVEEAVEWLPDWLDGRSLPLAVELRLEARGAEPLPALLRHPLRVPLEAAR
ncbi:MAG TPA: type II secretion system protein [Longimicrobiales bacterium]|nr:type II secretion system protein [Longimicrobiales bacterium]